MSVKDNWSIEEDMYLFLPEVKKLRSSARRAKKKALKLKQKVPVRDWFLVELGLATGLRVSEMAALECGDMLFNNGYQHVFVRNGKGGKSRLVTVSSDFTATWAEFQKWKKANGEAVAVEDPVFFSVRTGGKMSIRALQKSFKRCLKRAKLDDYGIHCLRHTNGTHLFAASGHNLRLVQKQLGHSSARVTEVYAHVLPDAGRKSVEKLYR